MTKIGEVIAINRYPVKSMRGEALEQAELRWTGLIGDRQYAFVRETNSSRFPWLTGREVADLVRHTPRFPDAANIPATPPVVTTPDGETYTLDDPALRDRLALAAGERVRLMHLGKGCQDAMPVSVVAIETLRRLEARFGAPLGLDRFRINIIIDADPVHGRETDWLGRTLRFGADGPMLGLGCGIQRCSMVTIDPATAERDAAVLRMVARDFNNEVGAYGSAARLGVIRRGDQVFLE
jgi:uncharacterized protein YcbX